MKSNHPPQPDRPIYKPLQRNGYVCRGLTSMENIYQEQEIYNTNLAILYIDYTMNNSEIPLYRWPGSRKCYLIVIFSFRPSITGNHIGSPSVFFQQIDIGNQRLKNKSENVSGLTNNFYNIYSEVHFHRAKKRTPRDIGPRPVCTRGINRGGSRTPQLQRAATSSHGRNICYGTTMGLCNDIPYWWRFSVGTPLYSRGGGSKFQSNV